MSFSQRFEEIRTGFEPAFWVANFTEIFERVAYYGTTAVLAIYLKEQLHFSSELTGWLVGTFGLVVWFLPILGGTLADRFGFRRALMFAYLVMTVGYFLLGSLSAPWMESLRQSLGDKWLVLAILMIPALGPGVVKPCVAGTTARASNENVRSLGYSIYYTLGEHRRSAGANCGVARAQATGMGDRERISRFGVERFSDVLDDALFLSRAGAFRGSKGCKRMDRALEYDRGARQFAVRAVPGDFFRLLHRFLAAIYFGAALHSRLRECESGRGPAAFRGSDRGDLFPDARGISDEKNAGRCGPWRWDF